MPSVKKNIVFRIVYEALNLLIPFVTTPYVARVLGADGVGKYSYTYSILVYFMIFGALGTMTYGSREISQNRDDKAKLSYLFWGIESVSVITSSISLCLWAVLICVSNEYKYYFMALTPFLLSTMLDVSWFFNGLEQIKKLVFRDTIIKIAATISLFLFVRSPQDIYVYCLIYSCFSLLGSMSTWMLLPGMIKFTGFKNLDIKQHFRQSLVYFIPTIAISIYTVLDKTLIGIITRNSYQNGYYEEATKLIAVLKVFAYSAINSVLTVRVSYLFKNKEYDEIKKIINKSIDLILMLSVGAAFGVIGIAENFIPIYLGEEFNPAVVILCVMSPLVIIVGVSHCMGSQYYTPSGKRSQSSKYIITGAAINLLLNLLLIPKYDALGAVIATLIAEITISFLYVKMSNGFMSFIYIFTCLWKKLIAGAIMFGLVYFTGKMFSNHFVVLLQIFIGLVTYPLILVIFKDNTIKYMWNIVFSKNSLDSKGVI